MAELAAGTNQALKTAIVNVAKIRIMAIISKKRCGQQKLLLHSNDNSEERKRKGKVINLTPIT